MSWVLEVFGANSTFESQAIFLFVMLLLFEIVHELYLNVFYNEKRVQSRSCVIDMQYKVQVTDEGDYIVDGFRVQNLEASTRESLSLPTRITRYYYNGRKAPFLRKEPLLLEGQIPEKEEQKFRDLLKNYFKHKKYDLESTILACRVSDIGYDLVI